MTKVWPNQSEILSDLARRADPPIRLTRGHEKKKIGGAVLLSFGMLLASGALRASHFLMPFPDHDGDGEGAIDGALFLLQKDYWLLLAGGRSM